MFRGIHIVGALLIIAAAILLLIATISSPIISDIALMRVSLTNSSTVTFGSFGHCIRNAAPTGGNFCYPKSIGYKPAVIMSQIDGSSFSVAGTDTADALTNAFILHPIACGLAFIAGLVAFGGIFGSLIGSMIAIVAWLITVVVMAIDFASFGIIKDHVHSDGSGSHASYAIATWCTLAAMVALFFGTIIVFLTCCSERRKNRAPKGDYTYHRSSARY